MNNNYINYLTANRKSVRTIETYTDYVQKMLKFIGKPDTEIYKEKRGGSYDRVSR